jgi:hypothetical protein
MYPHSFSGILPRISSAAIGRIYYLQHTQVHRHSILAKPPHLEELYLGKRKESSIIALAPRQNGASIGNNCIFWPDHDRIEVKLAHLGDV